MNVKQGIVPPSGWHYMQGNQRVPPPQESVNTYEELLEAVQTFRLENGIDVGEVKADVDQYICSNYPNQCNGLPPVAAFDFHPRSSQGRFIDRITNWAIPLVERQISLVSKHDAEERARTCIGCNANVKWEHQCPPCVEKAKRLMALIRRGRDIDKPNQNKILACKFYNHDNRTAIWLKREDLQPHNENQPRNCWL